MPAHPIQARSLTFAYPGGENVLDIDEFSVAPGEHVFLHGPSGSGKTTLLSLLTGILTPSSGSLEILGNDMLAMSRRKVDRFRGAHLGYIFQMFNLIPYLNVEQNIILPCQINTDRQERLQGRSLSEAARDLAEHLGIDALLHKQVGELSVGQQQRVAAARALMGSPEVVIADEPTSALDTDFREAFLKLLFKEAKQAKSTVVFVSHDRSLMPLFPRVVALGDINRVGH